MMDNAIEVYIHIPFCVKKCDYCDFLSFASDDDTKLAYVKVLIKEIEQEAAKYADKSVGSVFIGGGTPSALSVGCIEDILKSLRKHYDILEDAEITIECNPGTLTKDKLEEYKASGINRLSIGLQSTDDRELKLLGRIHDYETFLDNYRLAREVGFNNINIDLISGLPRQNVKEFELSLKRVIELNPEHVSCYSLIVEEDTLFYDKYSEGKACEKEMPGEEKDREIYHLTGKLLEEAGYHRYEISNYSKQGHECEHNIGYWTRREYIGFGLGSASLYNNVRWNNTRDMKKYLDCILKGTSIKEDEGLLSDKEQMEEYVFLGLRLIDGISLDDFENAFGIQLFDIKEYRVHTERMLKEGLLELVRDKLRLTSKGLDLANYVMSGFIMD